MRRLAFTLLEIMVGISLILIAAGAVGFRVYGAVQKKKFETDVSKILFQIKSCSQLSANTQADWCLLIENREGKTILNMLPNSSIALASYEVRPSPIGPLKIHVNDQDVERVVLEFSPNGAILPKARIKFSVPGQPFEREIDVANLFQADIAEKPPIRPNDK